MKSKQKSAAIVTIKGASAMTKKGRKNIATWLRRHAVLLERHGNNYSKLFRGRYLYRSQA